MSLRLTHVLLCAVCACTSSAYAQHVTAGAYLAPLIAAERTVAGLPPGSDTTTRLPAAGTTTGAGAASAYQALGTMRAFAGDTQGAIAAFDVLTPPRTPKAAADVAAQPDIAGARAEDAIQAIVAQARGKRVVILNEAHHVPMHRAFAKQLAAELRKIGYAYLACETFGLGPDGASPDIPGRTVLSTGYYTKDPVFAEFINAAVADKWTFVAYEHIADQPAADPKDRLRQREEGQARNLVERIFSKDPQARVFIYVGYGHLYRSPSRDSDFAMMGEYLYRMTNLDQVLVSQTVFYAHPDPRKEDSSYDGILKAFPASKPFVLRAADGRYLTMGSRVDMQVVFPRYGTHGGRPDWLATLAGRNAVDIPFDLLPKQGRRLIKAVAKDAGANAVPADVVLVEAGKPAPVFMLPRGGVGDYRYLVEDEPAAVEAAKN
jgi:hypothetical protein